MLNLHLAKNSHQFLMCLCYLLRKVKLNKICSNLMNNLNKISFWNICHAIIFFIRAPSHYLFSFFIAVAFIFKSLSIFPSVIPLSCCCHVDLLTCFNMTDGGEGSLSGQWTRCMVVWSGREEGRWGPREGVHTTTSCHGSWALEHPNHSVLFC